jgi:hypothetical protein
MNADQQSCPCSFRLELTCSAVPDGGISWISYAHFWILSFALMFNDIGLLPLNKGSIAPVVLPGSSPSILQQIPKGDVLKEQ